MKLRLGLVLTVMLFLSMQVFATTQATNTNTVSPALKVTVTVQKAIQLTLGNGTVGTACNLTGSGSGFDYTLAFGTVDALAIASPACGLSFAPTTPGTTPAVYYTNYTLTPAFSSQAVTTNTVGAYISTDFTMNTMLTITSTGTASGVPASIAAFSPLSKLVGSPTSVGTNLVNSTAVTRWIGVQVTPQNGTGTWTGADSAIVTYTMTVN